MVKVDFDILLLEQRQTLEPILGFFPRPTHCQLQRRTIVNDFVQRRGFLWGFQAMQLLFVNSSVPLPS